MKLSILLLSKLGSAQLTDDEESRLLKNPLCNGYTEAWGKKCELKVVTERDNCIANNGDNCEQKFEEAVVKCPCREQCYQGCPCLSLNCRWFVDPSTDLTKVMTNDNDSRRPNASLSQGLYLYQSDEFENDWDHMWNNIDDAESDGAAYTIENGVLKQQFQKNGNNYIGNKKTLNAFGAPPRSSFDYRPIFGYYEASIKVDPIRKGRACQFYLIPERYDLNPDDITDDPTARKGGRITIMDATAWSNTKYKVSTQWLDGNNALTSDPTVIDAPNMSDGNFHTYGVMWTAEKIDFYFDGELKATIDNQDQIPINANAPIYPTFNAGIFDWLGGGPEKTNEWPASCEVDYYRHYVFDEVNPDCHPLDLDEMAKCEAEMTQIAGDQVEAQKLIAENCPCHANCYFGCGNCDSWECAGRHLVDPETPAGAQPMGTENSDNPENRGFELVWSDEFNGKWINTNKWHSTKRVAEIRKVWPQEEEWTAPKEYITISNNDPTQHNWQDGKGTITQIWSGVPVDENTGRAHYKSGRLSTNNLYAPVYGWFEARMSVVPTNGIQSAWWLWPENGTWDYRLGTGQENCPNPNNAWWGAEIDIIEANKFRDAYHSNLHYGGYKSGPDSDPTGCYENAAEPHEEAVHEVPGLHTKEGEPTAFHVISARWSDQNGGIIEWFFNGEKVRTIDDPNKVSRGGTHMLISGGIFDDPDYKSWNFVDGNVSSIPFDQLDVNNPVYKHEFDYVRVWKEVANIDCGAGMRQVGRECVDINDCEDINTCGADEECVNTMGSFECHTTVNCHEVPDDEKEACCKSAGNAVDHRFNRNRVTIIRRSDDGYTLRVRFSQTSENIAYSPLVAFGVKDCGGDFINKLNSGEITVAMMDSEKSYKLKHQSMGQLGSHRNVVFQFEHTPCTEACLGNNNVDQADFVLLGTGKADMGNKDIEERCLKRTKIGHLGLARQHVLAEEDKTFCVSWVQKFW